MMVVGTGSNRGIRRGTIGRRRRSCCCCCDRGVLLHYGDQMGGNGREPGSEHHPLLIQKRLLASHHEAGAVLELEVELIQLHEGQELLLGRFSDFVLQGGGISFGFLGFGWGLRVEHGRFEGGVLLEEGVGAVTLLG